MRMEPAKLLLHVHHFFHEFNRARNIGQIGCHEVGSIVHRRVCSGDATNGSVKIIKTFFLDSIRDLCRYRSKGPLFFNNDQAIGFLN